MLKSFTVVCLFLSLLMFNCGETKTTSEKSMNQTNRDTTNTLSYEVDSLARQLDQEADDLKKKAEDTKESIDKLLKEL